MPCSRHSVSHCSSPPPHLTPLIPPGISIQGVIPALEHWVVYADSIQPFSTPTSQHSRLPAMHVMGGLATACTNPSPPNTQTLGSHTRDRSLVRGDYTCLKTGLIWHVGEHPPENKLVFPPPSLPQNLSTSHQPFPHHYPGTVHIPHSNCMKDSEKV